MSLDIASYLEPQAQREVWNLPIDHWSPSSLAMLQRCPRQWQQRYIRGRKQRPAEAPLIGTAVHKAVERNYRQKVESERDLPIVELLDWYAEDAFPRTVVEEEDRAGIEAIWDTDPERARARGKVMLAEYQNVVAGRVQPQDVELVIQVDFGLPVPVEGRFDVDREYSVIDVKTGKSKVTTPKEDWRIQAAVYSAAREKPVEFHSVTATAPKEKPPTVSVVTPLEEAGLLVHPTRRERSELARSLRTLSALACFYMDMYGPDEEWPTLGRFHGWACGYCGYRKDCPAWEEA